VTLWEVLGLFVIVEGTEQGATESFKEGAMRKTWLEFVPETRYTCDLYPRECSTEVKLRRVEDTPRLKQHFVQLVRGDARFRRV
jgi:hypothetical protein